MTRTRHSMPRLITSFGMIASMTLLGVTASGEGSLPLPGDNYSLEDAEFPTGDGGDPHAPSFGAAQHWNVLNFGPGVPAAVPSSFSLDRVDDEGRTQQEMLLTTQANPDVGDADSLMTLSRSTDSGMVFSSHERPEVPLHALSMARLDDGSLLSVDFIPEWTDESKTQVDLVVRTSKDGRSWETLHAPVSIPADKTFLMDRQLRVHRRIIEAPDGTLMVPAYTRVDGGPANSTFILQSADEGHSWTVRSFIPLAKDVPGSNEVGWSYTSDGRLLAVMRTTHSPVTKLVYSYSDDDGLTWTPAKYLVDREGAAIDGIFPDLNLQPNGTLLLATGRPDVRISASLDGTGKTWEPEQTVFANYPSEGKNGRFDGTSGNNTIENVGSSRSILFYDQCHVWGCGAYNQQFGVSASYVGTVTPGTGRIDLETKILDGSVTVAGNVAKPKKHIPQRRPEAAVDGSTRAGSEALLTAKKGAKPALTFTLDDAYPVNRFGLMLGQGEAQSATISVSADGTTWKDVVSIDSTKDRAMRYYDIDPTEARFLRITGAAGATTPVTEFEAYTADRDTFENELPFSIPRGWTDATNSWVTDVPNDLAYSDIGGHHSATTLRLWDKFTDDNARISKPFAPANSVTASAQWAYSDGRAPFTAGIAGEDGEQAWQFRISSGAKATDPQVIEAFDGSSWQTLGTVKTKLAARTYVPVTIQANAETATLTIGEESFSTSAPAGASDQLTELQFSTGDAEAYGGIYYLDDVRIGA